LFTYEVNEDEAKFLKLGMRVAVPFGKSKIVTALVHSVHTIAPERYEAKEIHQILDEEPIIQKKQLAHWQWIATYYMCALGEVMKAALPGAFLLASETLISKSKTALNTNDLSDDEFLIYEALENHSELRIQELMNLVQQKNIFGLLRKMLSKNAIQLREEIFEQYKPKQIRYIKLAAQYDDEEQLIKLLEALSRAPKQREVILSFFALKSSENEPITVKRLKEKSKASSTIIKSLVDKNILSDYLVVEDRIQFSGETTSALKALSPAQEIAYSSIQTSFEKHDTTLLHGVTSSGKTEVYVKLIEAYLKQGKQVLYLLPEIALTAQLIRRLSNYFGVKVAVFHSKYSVNERVEVWNNVLHNRETAQIIIGARSSVLLPFADLGFVIVDEEHETSYKQFDPAPRYHARDAAIVLAKLHQAKVLLGSATPSLESYFNTKNGKFGLVTLTERYGNMLLPEISLIDIKDKHKRKRMTGHFSDTLKIAIDTALADKEQVILFQNRRGFSPILECNTCGNATQCPNCDVSLTYHQYKKQLRCHYCGYHMAMQNTCISCGSTDLNTKGFGTEQIEEEVKQLFPEAAVSRMDLDTTRGKYGYQKIISAFEHHKIDILVGTQMLTKGLDFKNVSLVGIMNADNMLNFPDFRAHERSYQLMQQVAGRSGRFKKRGKVLIQTFNPYHKILDQVATNAYQAMYVEQIDQRHVYKYPPINRLIKITFKNKDFKKVNDGALWFYKSLHAVFNTNVLGPEAPVIARVRNQYIQNVLLKIPEKQSLKATKTILLKIQNSFSAIPQYRGVRVVINVDNY
jgi:primosomal protein N' (replication factor Y)